jgi:dCMP deaminase
MKHNLKLAHMQAAHAYSKLSYCVRQQVGCIIVNDDRVISIGYNGTPPGWENVCEDESGLTKPEVIHAEQNAIMKLAKSHESGEGAVMFCTHSPCISCATLIPGSGIIEVYYHKQYRTDDGLQFLRKCNIPTTQLII